MRIKAFCSNSFHISFHFNKRLNIAKILQNSSQNSALVF
ncbi:hypothetical protein HD_1645 [[Haemophilus] ducreyi 35000HP]|uniref:Uncharacterized protein n=1 Tax=Haemophilus ducreyi (strain 35000HP / ATCC 700724) TaxID=233412 RepID=Q7VL40_HAEDU|nr:hypothetical protein HD_1645 [[Haemophilus] ducreyi 35000HP]